MSAAPVTFSTELKVFEKHREDWSRLHPGKYVVIQDETVLDEFFSSYAEALKAGLRTFGVTREFLVKQIWRRDPVYLVS
jgi:hypothetical protein